MDEQPILKPRFFWIKLFFFMIALFVVTSAITVGGAYFGLRYLAKRAAERQQAPTFIEFTADAAAPVLGNAAAPVTIIAFADFQCPFCKSFHDLIFNRLKTDYVDTGKAKIVFQDFAFLGPESTDAAAAARCANDQGKFWEYFDALYGAQTGENSGDFTEANLLSLGASINLNPDQFNSCVKAKLGQAQVAAETDRATKAGITGTPTLLVNGKVIDGMYPQDAEKYYQDLSKTIDDAAQSSK